MNKRVFSKQDVSLDYVNYLKIKKGTVILNNDYNKKISCLKRFVDYNTFITLTIAFYNKINKTSITKPPVDIIQAKNSRIYYEELVNHINTCDYCYCQTNTNGFLTCKEAQQIMYPYGNAEMDYDNKNFSFPQNINVKRFCNATTVPFSTNSVIDENANKLYEPNVGSSENVTVEEETRLKTRNKSGKNDPEVDYSQHF